MSDEEKIQKSIQFYAVLSQAWISTRMEKDKSLLGLSAGGVGLLTTLLTTSSKMSELVFWGFLVAIVAFIVCASSILFIFQRNSKYLSVVIKAQKDEPIPKDHLLTLFDHIAIISFILGLLCSLWIGFYLGNSKLEKAMSDKEELVLSINSFNGVAQDLAGKSLSDVGQISPDHSGDNQPTAHPSDLSHSQSDASTGDNGSNTSK